MSLIDAPPAALRSHVQALRAIPSLAWVLLLPRPRDRSAPATATAAAIATVRHALEVAHAI